VAAGLPRQDHVYKTTDEWFRFQIKKFDEIRCIPLRIRVRSRNIQPHLQGDINEAPTCVVLVHAPVTNSFGEKRSGVQGSFIYFDKGCGDWVFVSVNGVF